MAVEKLKLDFHKKKFKWIKLGSSLDSNKLERIVDSRKSGHNKNQWYQIAGFARIIVFV